MLQIYKKLGAISFITVISILCLVQISSAGDASLDFRPGEIIIKLKPDAVQKWLNRGQLKSNVYGKGSTVTATSGGEFLINLFKSNNIHTGNIKSLKDQTLSIIERLKKNPDVEYVQPNYLYKHHLQGSANTPKLLPDDKLYLKQWHYFKLGTKKAQCQGGVGLPEVWHTNIGKREIVVAVIDTGILSNHEDISGSGNLLKGYDF